MIYRIVSFVTTFSHEKHEKPRQFSYLRSQIILFLIGKMQKVQQFYAEKRECRERAKTALHETSRNKLNYY